MPPFNVEPKVGPSILNPSGTKTSEQGQTARERAIAKLLTQEAKPTPPTPKSDPIPVQDANHVSPEELSAIKPSLGQASNNEAPPASSSEPPAEVTPKAETPSDPLSTHYAQLARKERALRAQKVAQEQSMKAREDQLKAREDALTARDAQTQSNYVDKAKLLQDPMSVLNELGLNYDQLTNLALNQPNPESLAAKRAIDEVKAQIKAVQDAREQDQKAFQDQQKQNYQQAVSQIRQEAKNLVNQDPEYSVIKSTESVEDVVELIEKTFEKDGILLTVEDAAREVENYLTEEAEKLWKIEKIRKRIEAASKPQSSQSADKATPAPSEPKQQPPQVKTLTNAVGSSRNMTAKERAILAFQGKLPS